MQPPMSLEVIRTRKLLFADVTLMELQPLVNSIIVPFQLCRIRKALITDRARVLQVFFVHKFDVALELRGLGELFAAKLARLRCTFVYGFLFVNGFHVSAKIG